MNRYEPLWRVVNLPISFPRRVTSALRQEELGGAEAKDETLSETLRYSWAVRQRLLAPQSIPFASGCVASSRWPRVGVLPLWGWDYWPQGQMERTLLL